jgi:hypothetical protein
MPVALSLCFQPSLTMSSRNSFLPRFCWTTFPARPTRQGGNATVRDQRKNSHWLYETSEAQNELALLLRTVKYFVQNINRLDHRFIINGIN